MRHVMTVERRWTTNVAVRVSASGKSVDDIIEAASRADFRSDVGGLPIENIVLAAAAHNLGYRDVVVEPSIDILVGEECFKARADTAFLALCRHQKTLVVLEAKRFENPLSIEASIRYTGFRYSKQRGVERIVGIAYELGIRLSDLPRMLGIVYHVFAFTPKRVLKVRNFEKVIANTLGLTERYITVLKGWYGKKAVKHAQKKLNRMLQSYSCRPPG